MGDVDLRRARLDATFDSGPILITKRHAVEQGGELSRQPRERASGKRGLLLRPVRLHHSDRRILGRERKSLVDPEISEPRPHERRAPPPRPASGPAHCVRSWRRRLPAAPATRTGTRHVSRTATTWRRPRRESGGSPRARIQPDQGAPRVARCSGSTCTKACDPARLRRDLRCNRRQAMSRPRSRRSPPHCACRVSKQNPYAPPCPPRPASFRGRTDGFMLR